ncbi:MAG: methylenetetrahydrofolate--tRNA-(uracil(54)-C(5))-methyltransferase (FADH(2)-oxidizing) TrmFO [Nitrospiraceae bacterium]|nr:methylenetetrahydrofolate--tRNA-(uracil(54)-C(5))-methyltransferase (FADH(2)-oxidizing) TrmFO [Nitrospiraceae bacterium]
MTSQIVVIGGGLAGSEAAWQVAKRGIPVILYEMRPTANTPAHASDKLAELVCSNSFGSEDILNASGILKEEMRRLDSLIVKTADMCRVPAGSALAVDREKFSGHITETLEAHPHVMVRREEVTQIPTDRISIIASGPLTSDRLANSIKELTLAQHLAFFDAISPIVDAETIEYETVFRASRYGKGGADYLNCPMEKDEYDRFYDALIASEKVALKDFENLAYFEGCIPVEVMAERGRETLLFGPMKPVGLVNPQTNGMSHAVVQLRQENKYGSSYNMVGFQTKLTYSEQRRVFRMIPGLEKAEFLRYGSVHRNTFINAPALMRDTLQVKMNGAIFFAGQLTGVEGYLDSAATGLIAGINAARGFEGKPLVRLPETTAHGSLIAHITQSDPHNFQPMNTNFGLFPPLPMKVREKDQKRRMIGKRALEDLEKWMMQSRVS